MRRLILLLFFTATLISSCNNAKQKNVTADRKTPCKCSDKCGVKDTSNHLSCKLTTPDLQKRKKTVIASLKNQVIEKRELADGFAFKFNGSDKMLDELTEFIKTERMCCDFFTFNLSVEGDKSAIWLELRGKDGSKQFIQSELGL